MTFSLSSLSLTLVVVTRCGWRLKVGSRLPPNQPLVIGIVVVIVVYLAVPVDQSHQSTNTTNICLSTGLSLSHYCPRVAAAVTAFIGVVRKAAGERVVVVVVVVVVPPSTHAARISFRAAPAGVQLPARRHRLVPTCLQRLAFSVVSSFYWKNRPGLCKRCWRTCSDSFDLKGFVFSVPLFRTCGPCVMFSVFSGSHLVGQSVGQSAGRKEGRKEMI